MFGFLKIKKYNPFSGDQYDSLMNINQIAEIHISDSVSNNECWVVYTLSTSVSMPPSDEDLTNQVFEHYNTREEAEKRFRYLVDLLSQ